MMFSAFLGSLRTASNLSARSRSSNPALKASAYGHAAALMLGAKSKTEVNVVMMTLPAVMVGTM